MSTISLTLITTATVVQWALHFSFFSLLHVVFILSLTDLSVEVANSLLVKSEYIPQHLALVANHLWVLICATTVYKVQG